MGIFSFLDSLFADAGKTKRSTEMHEQTAFQNFAQQKYFGQHINIDSCQPYILEDLLVSAVAEYNELVVKYLLKHQVNAKRAIIQTDSETLLQLLQRNGASLKGQLIDPSVVEHNKAVYIQKFIRFGANPNYCFISNEYENHYVPAGTPIKVLPLTYCLDSVESVECLLKHGANPLEPDYTNRTSLDYALLHASIPICELIMTHIKATGQQADISSSLLTLMKARKSVSSRNIHYLTAKTKYLIDLGADVNKQDDDGISVVMAALARKGIASILQLLVSHGANLELKDGKGRTALVRVLNKKDIVGFETLERLGAKISNKARLYYEGLIEQESSKPTDVHDENAMSSSEIRGMNGQQLAYMKSIHKE